MRRLPGLVVIVVLLTSGCTAFSEADLGRLPVVGAFYPLSFVLERVGGDRVDVTTLTQPGAEPHDLELGVRETAAIAEAALISYLADFQPAVDDAIEQTFEGDALEAGSVVGLEPAAEGHDHAEEPAGDAEDHGDLDPHFWLDPERMALLGDAVEKLLLRNAGPADADRFAANAAAFRDDMAALDAAYADGLADCERSTVVVSHDAFGYLAKYGIEVEPVAGLSPGAEPTPADLAHLQEVIADNDLTTVFSERLASPQLTETLARDMGVDTAVLDPIEGLTDETADEDYVSLMRANLEALRTANGCG